MKRLLFILFTLIYISSYSQAKLGSSGGLVPTGGYAGYYATYMQGGLKSGWDTVARNNVASYLRDTTNFLFLSTSDNTFWVLKGGILNSNYVKLTLGMQAGDVSTKMNFTDTAAMLANYQSSIIANSTNIAALTTDTATIQPRLNDIIASLPNITGKVNISDTAAMLANYQSSISGKVNISDTAAMLVNSRNGIITLLNLKANIASPVFTGNPTAPTSSVKDSTTSLATTAFVTAAVSASTIPDATNALKGKIMLAGDLAGTADLPVVADLAITTTKIADANITTSKILDANITTTKIADANVTTAKIADASVTYAKIQNITPVRLLGNPTGTSGASHEIALGKGLNFSNDSLYTNSTAARDTFTADITVTSTNGLGQYANGSIIPAKGFTANEVLLRALTPLILPTYTQPSATISGAINGADPNATTYEIYSPFSITLTGNFIKGDAGLPGAAVYSGGVSNTTLAANPDVIAAGAFTTAITYKVTYSYAAGVVKTDNLGAPYGTAVIAASLSSPSITYTPVARRYWGRCAGNTPTSAEIVAAVGGSNTGTDLISSNANTCTISAIVPAGSVTSYYFYAYLGTMPSLVSAFIGGFESLPTLNAQTINVDKNGKTISYTVYVSNVPTSGDVNLIAK